MSYSWLPEPLPNEACGGDDDAFCKLAHKEYRKLFYVPVPPFMGLSVAINNNPCFNGYEYTFWHLATVGKPEPESRTIDVDRCARICWPLKIMERCPTNAPNKGSDVLWWKEQRGRFERISLALDDFSYVVVIEDRVNHAIFWTAFLTRYNHEKRAKKKAFENFWAHQRP